MDFVINDPITKERIFYVLCFISIAFVIFVYVSRYMTRNNDEDENYD